MSCEFDCASCGVHVFAVGVDAVPPGQRCGVCQWVEDIVDPVERETLRWALQQVIDAVEGKP